MRNRSETRRVVNLSLPASVVDWLELEAERLEAIVPGCRMTRSGLVARLVGDAAAKTGTMPIPELMRR